jgi:site-specific recombinase XerD
MRPTDFSYYLSDFLTAYLSGQRNLSTNTIKSYRDTFVFLLDYIKEKRQISPEKVSIAQIDKLMIEGFLIWLECSRNNSIATRNQRLAAIHAFFRYLQSQKPEYMFHSQKILSIPIKKAPQKVINYLSEERIKQLLAEPDISSVAGRRDQTLLSTLYDTGARVQELVDLKVRDVRLESPAIMCITGKGRKTRHVPIMSKTAKLLSAYLNEQKLTTPDKLDHPLFFNSRGTKLTRQGITYIIQKYSDSCNFGQISAHRLRHAKAMHLTQADINPIYIRDFLGHADLKTTEIYSKTNTEMKRKALEKMNNTIVPNTVEDWNNNEGLLEWLNNLGRD